MGPLAQLLDRSVFFSFDRSGYLRHARRYDPRDLERTMAGKVCLVTGANSGLGLALAHGLAARGAEVHMLCRHAARGEEARQQVAARSGNPQVHLQVVDVASLTSIDAFTRGFPRSRVDVLIHNAGLLPQARELTEAGLELTVATHLVGPFALTRWLGPRLAGARVVFVSSGGMYTQRLDVDAMLSTRGPYDGVAAYARTKRGQVVLSELLAADLASSGATVNAMHPGWAATAGVERSLPRFWTLMRGRLRSAEQGADTALWLAVAERVEGETGRFWFDRAPVSTHLLPWTHEAPAQRRRLWELCETCTAAAASNPVGAAG